MAQYHFGKHMRFQVRPPGFPVELVGVGELHAAFLTESRRRELLWSLVQEIRVAIRFFPSAIGRAKLPKSVLSDPAVTRGCGEKNASFPGTTGKPETWNLTANGCRSRINTGDTALLKNTSGDAFGVPRLCCLLRCLLTSSLLFSWLPSSLASLLLLSWLPFFLFSLCRVDIERCKRYFAVNECIESQKNSVKKKIAFREDQFTNRNR
jgi:hypothetical protein